MMNDLEIRAIVHLEVHDYNNIIKKEIRPSLYSTFFNSLDGIEPYNFSEVSALTTEKDSVVLEIAPLPIRRLWNITLYAHNCEYYPLTDKMELGTHDFHNISITSQSDHSDTLMVTGDIIPGSSSIGILVIVYSLENDSNICYNLVDYTEVQQQPRMYPVIIGLPMDEYEVVIFVVEEDSRPFSRAAATPRTVHIKEIIESQPSPINYQLQPTVTGVCVNCTLRNTSFLGCMAVVHQRISQLSSSGLMNIESSHIFNRSGDTAYGCIEGVNLIDYQVGVLEVTRQAIQRMDDMPQPSPACALSCTAGIVIGAVLVMCMVAVMFLAIMVYVATIRKQKCRTRRPEQVLQLHVSDTSNQYEMVPPRVAETDGHEGSFMYTTASASGVTSNTTATLTNSGEEPNSNTAPPVPPPRSKDTDLVYTKAVTISTTSFPQPATLGVVYDDIKAFQTQDGQLYAILPNLKTTGELVDPDPNRTVYSDIQHILPGQQIHTSCSLPPKNIQTSITPQPSGESNSASVPFTLEHMLPDLLPYAPQWKLLGEALLFDEDHLDEIYTNNETDEQCLQNILELYMARLGFSHSWEKIQEAVKNLSAKQTKQEKSSEHEDNEDTCGASQQGSNLCGIPQEHMDKDGEDLMEQQDTLDQEIASQKSESENGVPTEDPPQHTERIDNEDTCDASQQGSNLCDNQHEDIMDKDDYPNNFDEQANEPSESSNHNDGQFESGKGTSPTSETASLTSDNRYVYDANKSECHQSNICAPLLFHTECEEENKKEFCDVLAPRSGTCSWSESVDGASEVVISSNWNFLHYCLHSKDA